MDLQLYISDSVIRNIYYIILLYTPKFAADCIKGLSGSRMPFSIQCRIDCLSPSKPLLCEYSCMELIGDSKFIIMCL